MQLRQQLAVHLLALVALIASAAADVLFTAPPAGSSVAAGSALRLTIGDSGTAPSVSDLLSYTLFLCAGGDDEEDQVQLLTISATGKFTSSTIDTQAIPTTLGGSDKNAYFFKIISPISTGGTVINYSSRFSFSGMKGVFPANIAAKVKSISSSAAPPTILNSVAPVAAAGPVAQGQFAIPFSMQNGPTKYAPMLIQPGTKITAKKTAPLYPTSAYKVASTPFPAAMVLTTFTQAPTGVPKSIANPAAPAPNPSDDMARFLNRWKD